MARYKCIMEYDGENYAGFQIQPNALTVQECTEKALSDLFGVATKITASGRTDSGVSARGQVIHFDSDTEIAEDKIPFALKSFPQTRQGIFFVSTILSSLICGQFNTVH